MDEWYDMTIEDLRKYEQETKELLDKIMKGDSAQTGEQKAVEAPKEGEGDKSEVVN
jgi:hypothetical protein